MKVLVLSVTAGEGHNSTAKAIKNALNEKDVVCDILDTYGYINSALRSTISNGYLFVSSHTKFLYSKAYRICEKRNPSTKVSISDLTNRVLSKKLMKYIEEYAPDVIVCTHIFASMLIDVLKVHHGLEIPAVGILTDFVFHPYWEECTHIDKIVTACEMLYPQAKRKGLRDDQIVPIGIPIRPAFSTSLSKEEACRELGIDADRLTLLIMGGSMGYGHIADTVKTFDDMERDFQMLVVCGNNGDAEKALRSMSFSKPVKVYGFVDNVNVMMDASDCIVTKPGGLTTSEALAKRLPMIIVNPIPGQEDRNREFLLNNGVAMAATKTCPIEDVVYQLVSNPARVATMRQCIDCIRKPNSTADLCRLIFELAQ